MTSPLENSPCYIQQEIKSDFCIFALCRLLLLAPISLKSLHGAGINALKEHHQICALDLDRQIFTIDKTDARKTESANLQALGEDGKAVNVPPEYLDEVAALTAEEKQGAGEWVLFELRTHQAEQAVE
jgi:hypothetical protein